LLTASAAPRSQAPPSAGIGPPPAVAAAQIDNYPAAHLYHEERFQALLDQ
jgi:hypothetical protein